MKIIAGLAVLLACAACSDSSVTVPGSPTGPGTGQLAVVNALSAGAGAQLRLDQSVVTLPALGATSKISLGVGTHQVLLSSSAGQPITILSFSIGADSTRTIVLSGGPTSAGIAFASDTAVGIGHSSPDATTLLINSAPDAGTLDLVVHQAGSDSVYRFGSFTAQPKPDLVPWVPGTYTFTVTNPGDTTVLASTQATLAASESWNVILTTSIEGGLVLQATKQ